MVSIGCRFYKSTNPLVCEITTHLFLKSTDQTRMVMLVMLMMLMISSRPDCRKGRLITNQTPLVAIDGQGGGGALFWCIIIRIIVMITTIITIIIIIIIILIMMTWRMVRARMAISSLYIQIGFPAFQRPTWNVSSLLLIDTNNQKSGVGDINIKRKGGNDCLD